MADGSYHEPAQELNDETRDMHRAIISLREELEELIYITSEWLLVQTQN
ncbi:MAG: hypothetical protein Q8K95_08915 [Nitrosomonas sp.]|nr:hypothetical protein [Nitrosomonas sp.]MDP1787399.1 hypothetical protein [Nitrosomonas sp.]